VWWFYFRDDPGTHRASRSGSGILAQLYFQRERKKDPVPWAALAKRMAPVTLVYFCTVDVCGYI